jgi:hypothetical protein
MEPYSIGQVFSNPGSRELFDWSRNAKVNKRNFLLKSLYVSIKNVLFVFLGPQGQRDFQL